VDKGEAANVLGAHMEPVEKLLRSLLHGEFSSLSLTFNDAQACNYETAQQWFEQGLFDDDEFVSDAEREKALRENSVWTLQWYPDTPAGFHKASASTLGALLVWVVENVDGEMERG